MVTALLISALALSATPVPLIYDTDMDTDVDDVGALAVLHALADQGEVELLAVVHSAPREEGPRCVQAVNRWYGRDSVPVGWTDWPDLATSPVFALYRHAGSLIVNAGADYVPTLARDYEAAMGGQLPPVEDGVKLYRKTLATAADASVVICTVGQLPALAGLLDSGPDEISPLTGMELVKKKVKLLVTMATVGFPEGTERFNWQCHLPAADKVVNNWPVAMAVMPHGATVLTGARLQRESAPENPCRKAYEIYVKKDHRCRSSWDLCAALYAVRGAAPFFKDRTGYRISLDGETGAHTWTEDPDSKQIFIEQVKPDEEIAEALDALMVKPPRRGKD